MSACGYKFYLQVFNSIYHKWAQWTSEISSWILEDKICIRKRACNILFIIQTPMARCCDALLLLAETEVAMTTMISSHVKDKNCIFTRQKRTGYFLPGGAVNHLPKKFLQVAQIFTKRSNRNEGRCNKIGRTGIWKWLHTVFHGQYLPSLSINYVATNKHLEKLPPQVY